MTASLERFLPDFEFSGIGSFQHGRRADDHLDQQPAEPEIDVDAVRAEARAAAEAEVRAELARRHQGEIEALEARHAAELAAVKAELETLAAQAIPAAVEARRDAIAETVAGDVEAVLAPLIDKAIRERILSGLAAEIRAILELDAAERIAVSGPEGLVEALKARLGEAAERLVVTGTDGMEIEVEVDRTRFATRLSEWAESVEEGLR